VSTRLRRQYTLARLIYQTWNDGYDLAKISPELPYTPMWRAPNPSDPEATSRVVQHIVIGELDLIAEAMTVAGHDGSQRCMDFGEFRQAFLDPTSTLNDRASIIKALFKDFRPDRRPVLWRLLLCQATIWETFIDTATATETTLPSGISVGQRAGRHLDWRRADVDAATLSQAVDIPLAAARAHAQAEFDRAVQYGR
jgi:hypothetical protein